MNQCTGIFQIKGNILMLTLIMCKSHSQSTQFVNVNVNKFWTQTLLKLQPTQAATLWFWCGTLSWWFILNTVFKCYTGGINVSYLNLQSVPVARGYFRTSDSPVCVCSLFLKNTVCLFCILFWHFALFSDSDTWLMLLYKCALKAQCGTFKWTSCHGME